MTTDDKNVDFYVQAIIDKSKHYMERDEQLLRNAVRKLLDQYATKRVQDEVHHTHDRPGGEE